MADLVGRREEGRGGMDRIMRRIKKAAHRNVQ
jgi:hypothetical protein